MRFTCFLLLVALLVGCNQKTEIAYLPLDELLKTPQLDGFEVVVEPMTKHELEGEHELPSSWKSPGVPLTGPYTIVPKTIYEIKHMIMPFRYRMEFDDKHYYISYEEANGWHIRTYLLKNEKGEIGAILLKAPEPERTARKQVQQRPAVQAPPSAADNDKKGDDKKGDDKKGDDKKGDDKQGDDKQGDDKKGDDKKGDDKKGDDKKDDDKKDDGKKDDNADDKKDDDDKKSDDG